MNTIDIIKAYVSYSSHIFAKFSLEIISIYLQIWYSMPRCN